MKYKLVNPSKPKSFSHSNVFTIKVKCKIDDCLNLTFGTLDKCALHCEKGSYNTDWYNLLLSEFTKLLNDYILNYFDDGYYCFGDTIGGSDQLVYELKAHLNNSNNIYESSVIARYFSEIDIVFVRVYFPARDSRDKFDYFKTLKMFRGVHFLDCHFYSSNLSILDVSFFFQDCHFKNIFDISPLKILVNCTNSIFSECIFYSKVSISSNEDMNSIKHVLFSGCKFKSDLVIFNLTFEKELINYKDSSTSEFKNLRISHSIFNKNLELNSVGIGEFNIEDTSFLSDFQIKKSSVGIFKSTNVIVQGVFDASESHFSYAKFDRVKFIDVADFEKAKFGESDKIVIASYPVTAIFRFVTFMTASNFKKVNFYYGLDFEDVDLREQPNFLKSKINPYNTNRETFRIIKNSFDSRGNTLEGNRFFVQEMKAFKQELKEEGSFWDKIVYNMNDFISEFGENYIRPILILITSIIIYTFIDYSHKYYFSSYDYFISAKIEPFWIFLNDLARNLLPFSRFLASKDGIEFISLLFYIWFAILIWQIIVSIKRYTQR